MRLDSSLPCGNGIAFPQFVRVYGVPIKKLTEGKKKGAIPVVSARMARPTGVPAMKNHLECHEEARWGTKVPLSEIKKEIPADIQVKGVVWYGRRNPMCNRNVSRFTLGLLQG